MKQCNRCKELKEESEFYKNRTTKSGLHGSCKECVKEYQRENRETILNNAKRYRKNKPDYDKEWNLKLKSLFLEMYGSVCGCCGEFHKEFLIIDHINGQIGIKRDHASTAYRKAIKEYRPDLYRILCMNCNHSYGMRGYCPHQKEK